MSAETRELLAWLVGPGAVVLILLAVLRVLGLGVPWWMFLLAPLTGPVIIGISLVLAVMTWLGIYRFWNPS